jgi:hypothetical protein
MLEGALLDWAGPEVALVGTWDARQPRIGILIQGRDAKAAIGAIRHYRATDVGKKMHFADATAFGVPYRYTRLDGVDPRWVEPAYGFVGTSLCIASARSLLERLLDDKAPKIEETSAFGGLFARLGRDLRLAAYLDPAVLPRFVGLLQKLAGSRTQDPRGATPLDAAHKKLEALATRVSGMALGAGLIGGQELHLELVVSVREDQGEG